MNVVLCELLVWAPFADQYDDDRHDSSLALVFGLGKVVHLEYGTVIDIAICIILRRNCISPIIFSSLASW